MSGKKLVLVVSALLAIEITASCLSQVSEDDIYEPNYKEEQFETICPPLEGESVRCDYDTRILKIQTKDGKICCQVEAWTRCYLVSPEERRNNGIIFTAVIKKCILISPEETCPFDTDIAIGKLKDYIKEKCGAEPSIRGIPPAEYPDDINELLEELEFKTIEYHIGIRHIHWSI